MKENSGYYGLIFECPMKEETENCAFRNIRKLDFPERIHYANNLSDNEKIILIKKHKSCLSGRENNIPFSRIAIFF